MSYELRNREQLGDLSFSFKRPRWLRKAQPGKILKKYALPIGLVAGSLFIPGVAPLAGKVIMGGAKFAGRGILRTGRLLRRGATGFFKSPVPKDFIGPPAPAGTPGTESMAEGLFSFGRNLIRQPSGTPPIGEDIPTATGPGFSPVPSIPTGPGVQNDAATMQTSGGGSGGMSPTTPFMDEATPEAAGAGAPKPGMSPLLIIGGLLLVGSMVKKSSRRR